MPQISFSHVNSTIVVNDLHCFQQLSPFSTHLPGTAASMSCPGGSTTADIQRWDVPLDNSITETFHTARNNESCVKSKAFRCLSSAGAPLDRDAWSGLLQTRQSLLKLRDCVRQGAGLTADLLSLAANQQLTISRLDGRLGKNRSCLGGIAGSPLSAAAGHLYRCIASALLCLLLPWFTLLPAFVEQVT